MNPINYRTPEEKTIYEYLEKLTDRELQEKQSLYLRNIEKSNERIKLNLQFWFYFTLAVGAITLVVFLNN